jgi:hypothetical protein
VALESRQEAYNYAKERFDVGLMNFDLISNIHNLYYYYFIRILFWNSNHQKLIHYVKEINLPLIGGAVVVIALLIILSKTGVIGNKDEGKEVETAVVNAITIVETVSATGKIQPEIEVKISSEVSGELFYYLS